METKIKRRYKLGDPEYKQYNEFFDRYLLDSTILNAGSKTMGVHTEFMDLPGIKGALAQIEGDETGRYKTHWGETFFSSITLAQQKLGELKTIFKSVSDRKEAQGHPRPKQWPPELLVQRLRWEAKLDVLRREAEFLNDRIANYQQQKRVEHNKAVLVFGPRGHGSLRNGVLAEIDGQETGYKDEVLIICDAASPYRGMAVSDYREFVSKPWLAQRRQWMNEKELKRKQEILEKGFSNTETQLGLRKIHPSSLPKWPNGVQNLLLVNKKKARRDSESGITN